MTIVHEKCVLCDFPTPSFAVQDFHRRVDHLRDDEPCEICGEWDEARTSVTEFGWAHDGCANQLAYDRALAHYERWLEGRESA